MCCQGSVRGKGAALGLGGQRRGPGVEAMMTMMSGATTTGDHEIMQLKMKVSPVYHNL